MPRTRAAVGASVVAAVLALVALGGCSSDDDGAGSSATTASPFGTVTPSTGPITTTTAVEGTPVADAEIYAQAGLTTEQGECIAASGVDDDFTATPGVGLTDPIVLTADNGKMVAVPAEIRTSTELETLLLTTLAAECAPADALTRLARIDGEAADAAALSDDLPVRMFQRRTEGATDAEVSCIEAKFREAPARLSSLAASPGLVEAQCAPAERLTDWRSTAIDSGLRTAGATDAERACLVPSEQDLALLGVAVDAVGSGEVTPDVLGTATPGCVAADRIVQLAVEIVAKGVDFGAEELPGR